MTIDISKVKHTRGGHPVRNLQKNDNELFCWKGEFLRGDKWVSDTWSASGSYFGDNTSAVNDLIETEESQDEIKEPSMTELDWTKPELLQRRDGGEWRLLATDVKGDQPIVIACKNDDGSEYVYSLFKNGTHSESIEYGIDIIPKPRRVTGWMNAYEKMNPGAPFWLWDTKEKAIENASLNCIGQIYIDAEVQQ